MSHRWYVVNTHSGFEKKVSQVIKEQAERKGLADHFSQVLVPMEEVIEVRRGKNVNAERKFFHGYILINMDMTDDTWHLERNLQKANAPWLIVGINS